MKIIKRLLNKALSLLRLSTTTQPSGLGPIYLPPPSPPSVYVVERREKPGKEVDTTPEPPSEEANEAKEPLELDLFDDPTEEDIVQLWESFKSAGLSSGDAWSAVMAGMALDMGFGRSKSLSQSTH